MIQNDKVILVTGASGKIGQQFINRLLAAPAWNGARLRALCHNRQLAKNERMDVIRGSIAIQSDIAAAMAGTTHVVHLATCKETPEDIIDVTIKGLFWLLEECRKSPTCQRLVLIGGDAGVGHFFYPHPIPVTETQDHSAYSGSYALSKVLEETMLEQYYIQYNLDGCCLRAPWIMEKDDFKYSLSFGKDVFGGPRWCDLVGSELAETYQATKTVPVMLDSRGNPVLRNFVHIDDLVTAILTALDHPSARQQLFNICMDEPVNYRDVANHLRETRNLPSVDIRTEFHSTWLDNSKAKFQLGWRPRYDLQRLINEAWDYRRANNDPRKIWYPG